MSSVKRSKVDLVVDDEQTVALHTGRSSVYLDQWVWSRLAAAARGRPRGRDDLDVLSIIRIASAAGVVFPLSATHYIETTAVTEIAQRIALSEVMAGVSHMRTLMSRHLLLRHQILSAMHVALGRPTFRPPRVEALGTGVYWAFGGEVRAITAQFPKQLLDAGAKAPPPELLCRMTQWAEIQFLCGPRDEDVEKLRRQYGYRPETAKESATMRLEWEQIFGDLLEDDPVSRSELRVRIQARELIHEHLELLTELFDSYGMSINKAFGGRPGVVGSARPGLIKFGDSIPSLRIAVDMKADLFRDQQRTWKVNDLHDIDALSLAIPYCDVVVADKAAVHSVHNAKADVRCGTKVTQNLSDLIDLLPELIARAELLGGDRTGWDWCSPGVGFNPLSPDMVEPGVLG